MRRLILFVPLLLVLLWVMPPFLMTLSWADPLTFYAASPATLLWFGGALLVTGSMCVMIGWHSAMKSARRFPVVRTVSLWLVMCWVFVPSVWMLLNNTLKPMIWVRAPDSLPLVWLGAACIGTCIALVSIGKRFRLAHEENVYNQHLLRMVKEHLNEGIALYSPSQQLKWVNASGQTALLQDGRTHPEISRLIERAVGTQRSTAQSFTMSEDVRVNVQVTPLANGAVSIMTRPVQNDAHQHNFYERFIRRIVHDMRNPLAAIIAHASNLHSAPNADIATWKNTALTIEHEAQRLTRLVDSMLFDARLSYVPLALEALDLADVIEEVFFQHDERAIREGKTIEIESVPAPFEGDRDLLVRAISNLVDNSLKYSSAGAVVRLTLESTNSDYLLKVGDTGDGIPPEYLPNRIFEALVRVRAKDGGSGLGLSIVKKIVELHGGQIAVESALGKGTLITLCLPK